MIIDKLAMNPGIVRFEILNRLDHIKCYLCAIFSFIFVQFEVIDKMPCVVFRGRLFKITNNKLLLVIL